jgi:transketolase
LKPAESILTGKAENVYGIVTADNPLGRGIRFGIAEQNMAMMSAAIAQDTLPGSFRPMSAFATSPQLYEELRQHNPKKAHEIIR